MWRYFGRAKADPSAPRAAGYCDKCGIVYQLNQLHFQYQYRGTSLANTQFRVCPRCMDKPSAFLKTLLLPADPQPVSNPRPGNVNAQMTQNAPGAWDQEINPGVDGGSPVYYAWDQYGVWS